jgi:hypothetical protein
MLTPSMLTTGSPKKFFPLNATLSAFNGISLEVGFFPSTKKPYRIGFGIPIGFIVFTSLLDGW